MIKLKKILQSITEWSYKRLSSNTPSVFKDRSRDVVAKLITKTPKGRYVYETRTISNGNKHRQWIKPQKGTKIDNINNDVILWCDCVDEKSWILMSNGELKQIKDIKPGDFVITHTGSSKEVINVIERYSTKDLVDIKVVGFPDILTVTEDHKFYSLKGNIECLCGCRNKLNKKFFGINGNPIKKYKIFSQKFLRGHFQKGEKVKDESNTFKWTEAVDFVKNEILFIPWVKNDNAQSTFNSNKLFLYGLYLAEGYKIKTKGIEYGIEFSLNVNEITLAEKIKEIFKAEYGKNTKVIIKEKTRKVKKGDFFKNDIETKTLYVSIYNKIICKDFNEIIIGDRCYNKKLTEYLINNISNADIPFILSGFLAGDGHIYKNGVLVFDTTSFALHNQLMFLMLKLKYRAISYSMKKYSETENKPITYFDSVIEPNNYRLPIYRISMEKKYNQLKEFLINILKKYHNTKLNLFDVKFDKEFNHCSYNDLGAFVTVKDFEKHKNDGRKLYDLTVKDDNSFIVNGVTVHNCGNFTYENETVLWRADASHKINSNGMPPVIRNPKRIKKLCKHLIACLEDFKRRI